MTGAVHEIDGGIPPGAIGGSPPAGSDPGGLPEPFRLDRNTIEAAIRANCFIGQYGDVPAVNCVAVTADALLKLVTAQATSVRLALEEARDLLLERRRGPVARSPAHNARLVLDRALACLPPFRSDHLGAAIRPAGQPEGVS